MLFGVFKIGKQRTDESMNPEQLGNFFFIGALLAGAVYLFLNARHNSLRADASKTNEPDDNRPLSNMLWDQAMYYYKLKSRSKIVFWILLISWMILAGNSN
jgi:hypothetical protein